MSRHRQCCDFHDDVFEGLSPPVKGDTVMAKRTEHLVRSELTEPPLESAAHR